MRGNDLFVANAGDSRCIVCRDGKAIEMSFDHKPEDEPELKRIENAGGRVTPDGRVNGGLNLSRAIGDHAYKTRKSLPLTEQMISPVPDIQHLTLSKSDSFVLLACDGIWNSLSSQEVVDFVQERMKTFETNDPSTQQLTTICEEVRLCILKLSKTPFFSIGFFLSRKKCQENFSSLFLLCNLITLFCSYLTIA